MAKKLKDEAAASNVTEATILEGYRGYVRHRKDLEEKQAELNSVRGALRSYAKEAKKIGIDMRILSRLYDDSRRDLADVQREERDRARYARFLGLEIGAQVEMVLEQSASDAPVDEGDDVYKARKEHERFLDEDNGESAGLNGHSREANPHANGTERAQTWDNGWLAGQKKLAEGMAPKTRRGRKGAAGGEMSAAA